MAPRAAASPELEAPTRNVIEHRHLLRHFGRMVYLRQRIEDPRAQVDAPRGVGEIGEDDPIGGEVRILVEEMMLGRPDILESRLVGGNRSLDVIHESVMFGVRVGLPAELGHERLDENAELHEDKSPSVVPIVARIPGGNEAISPGYRDA